MNDRPQDSSSPAPAPRSKRVAQTFEELLFYQRARELTNGVYAQTREGAFARDRGLVDQIRRAAVSVMSNIAEGFERGNKTEFVQYLYIAKGSCGEVRAQLQVARDQDYLADADYARLRALAVRTSGMIANFIAHLQQSCYAGTKATNHQRGAVRAFDQRQAALGAAIAANTRGREPRADA